MQFLDWLCDTKLGFLVRLLICTPIAFGTVYGLAIAFSIALNA